MHLSIIPSLYLSSVSRLNPKREGVGGNGERQGIFEDGAVKVSILHFDMPS